MLLVRLHTHTHTHARVRACVCVCVCVCIYNNNNNNNNNNLKVALQTLGRNFYKNIKESSLYSQSLLIFIHRTPVVERHPITREIRDFLWPRSTPTGNTVYFYMSSSFIYTLKIHRRSFKHSVR